MKRDELIRSTSELLKELGMDDERSNERSALTFLALLQMEEEKEWCEATGEMYTTRQIMDWIRDRLGVEYAANSRETIRRFTLHQFIAGGLVEYNADDPTRPTNSPKNNYRVTPRLLEVIKAMGTDDFNELQGEFLSNIDTWRSQQDEIRNMNQVPVLMPDGSVSSLSAGGQNLLIKEMVEQFCPRYIPGGIVLYIDDTSKKRGEVAGRYLNELGIEIPEHGKAPDLIVYDESKGWVFMMEACSSHGPIDVIRKIELRELFPSVINSVVFVSCFPDRATMRKYLSELAWETEAWCADAPDHVIHLDGERFLGPYGE